ncbi:hypothetical protein AXF42_Ash005873 [Apostasia shenzhenica]|uniref:Uncharacterized protein n=1 Tax=Apostasia shenzhenica TaxID=1088818 RepID=A0A2I0BCL6_9ASPA|nr:hypothetical protein AXF42_Ash005873 [Apostasia shenzhenica]
MACDYYYDLSKEWWSCNQRDGTGTMKQAMYVRVINFSTGRVINKVHFESELTAMDYDHTGQFIFSGDAQGYIYTASVNSHTGSISRTHKNRSMRSKSPITTVQYRTFSLVARCPVLLVCAQDGNLCFFREEEDFETLVGLPLRTPFPDAVWPLFPPSESYLSGVSLPASRHRSSPSRLLRTTVRNSNYCDFDRGGYLACELDAF